MRVQEPPVTNDAASRTRMTSLKSCLTTKASILATTFLRNISTSTWATLKEVGVAAGVTEAEETVAEAIEGGAIGVGVKIVAAVEEEAVVEAQTMQKKKS